MRHRLAKALFLPAVCVALPASLLVTGRATAEATPGPITSANFDPSDVYFQGFLLTRSAEKLETSGDFAGAAEKHKKAAQLFDAVKRFFPTWKSEMVTGRCAQNLEAQSKIAPQAEEQRRKSKNLVAELEGGEKRSGTLQDSSGSGTLSVPGVFQVNPLETRRLAEAEAEVRRLKSLLNQAPSQDPEQSRNESRITDLKRRNDHTENQLRAAESNLQSLRNQLAKNPMEGEVTSLNQRISGLEQEKQAMAMALTQSRSSHTDALARAATLEADLKVMQQKQADLGRNLKAEREVANSVVAGQRTQLKALTDELAQKNLELGKATERIAGLIKELGESKDAYADLSTERDSLLIERDQMSALLKLNEDGRIQDLVQQNMGLAKNLREANDKVERLNLDSNSAKDDTTTALRDLAIAKSHINRFHQEKRDQDKRLEELESRLKSEDSALAAGQAATNPEETNMLREIIRKHISIQERRRQARDLLVEAVKSMGSQDEQLAQAVSLFDSQEIELTPDEQHLMASKQVDGEFVSPYARSRDAVGKSTEELKQDIAVMERTAEKSYAAGRLAPTRELFEMIIEQHPGHIPTLCKLGIIDLKLNNPTAAVDTFRRAVELDATNPYAHRMLGYSFMLLGDMPAAELNVKQSVQLAPDNPRSQMLLGSIFERRGNPQEAESCYKAAIIADPLASDPYFNLAQLFTRGKRLDQARTYYSQALDHGAKPDPSLEQLLVQQ
jgi:Flp pilus assembly protein TadD